MSSKKALILNIQRYSLHDGEGIRTVVFFKGCPLKCPWCSNPESIDFTIEKVKIESKCIHCNHCDFDVDECPSGAITEFGKYMTVDEIIKEILKDNIFYETSNGGVTLSGGEVLFQCEFAKKLLIELKKLGIHTAIETSGHGNTQKLIELSEFVDLFLFDLKIMNPSKSKKIIGADIDLILYNLNTLVNLNKTIIPRIPLIPGYTLNDSNIKSIIQILKKLNFKTVHLLPFHQYGSNKYTFLNKSYDLKNIDPPCEDSILKVKNMMKLHNINAIIGGL